MLLVPTLLFAWAVQHPETPYWVFCLIAATAGLGGGNFASSMANINFFYPTEEGHGARPQCGRRQPRRRGDPVLPADPGRRRGCLRPGQGERGRVPPRARGLPLRRAGSVAAASAWRCMNNLTGAKSSPREQMQVVQVQHTWVMSFLYVGTFGSFIGYSAAMPLLIKLNFWNQPDPTVPGIGINFAYYAFLGALVGSIARPFGGWLADKYGGARVTLWTFVAMIAGTLGVIWTLDPADAVPSRTPATPRSAAVDANSASSRGSSRPSSSSSPRRGIGNGSTYRMIPLILGNEAKRNAPRTTSTRPGHRHQGVHCRDRHRRCRRRAGRLPHPDDLRRPVDRRPGRGGQASPSRCSPASTWSAWPRPGSSTCARSRIAGRAPSLRAVQPV